ncbi:MAG: flagellar motor switch protein FliG [Treponema sp.]|nr:flagellar motor switch protein FliG [Treponema sp.]
MDVKDFRAAAYMKNAASNDKKENSESKNQKNTSADWTSGLQHFTKETVTSEPVKENAQTINTQPQSVTLAKMQKKTEEKMQAAASIAESKRRLNNATDFLKSGGLIKVPEGQSQADGKDSVYRRVAKFLLIIGEDEAAKVLPHLSEKQIEKIIPEIASIRSVSKEEEAVILEEFNALVKQAKTEGGVETAREMLEKAYGKARAEELIKKSMPLQGEVPFRYLEDMENDRIYQLIKGENVGVQSIVLSHLDPKKAAGIINSMAADEKKEVVLRLAKMEAVSPDIIRRIDQAIHEKSLHLEIDDSENIDGRNALAQILKKMDSSAEKDILSYLSDDDPDLGKDLKSRLFTLDDVVNADDQYLQKRLAEMKESEIAYLIAAKPEDFREKILSNISAGRRAEVREQEDILKPMRRSDCEAITSTFMAKLRQAYEQGSLYVKNRNDEQYI